MQAIIQLIRSHLTLSISVSNVCFYIAISLILICAPMMLRAQSSDSLFNHSITSAVCLNYPREIIDGDNYVTKLSSNYFNVVKSRGFIDTGGSVRTVENIIMISYYVKVPNGKGNTCKKHGVTNIYYSNNDIARQDFYVFGNHLESYVKYDDHRPSVTMGDCDTNYSIVFSFDSTADLEEVKMIDSEGFECRFIMKFSEGQKLVEIGTYADNYIDYIWGDLYTRFLKVSSGGDTIKDVPITANNFQKYYSKYPHNWERKYEKKGVWFIYNEELGDMEEINYD